MSPLYQLVEQISREKGVDAAIIIAALEDAILTAAKKYYRTEEPYQARFNQDTGEIEVFLLKRVVSEVADPSTEISLKDAKRIDPKAEVGGEVEAHKPTDVLGRIAAQTAKQVIFQKVREAERDHIFSEYGDRIGQLVTGIVKRAESGDLVVDLGKTEALLPRREQSRAEVFNPGERIRVVIVRVSRTSRSAGHRVPHGPGSARAALRDGSPRDLRGNGGGQKRGAGARGPGQGRGLLRTRTSTWWRLSAKGGPCSGHHPRLRREIDIVEWSDDARTFAINALNPAKVSRVAIVDDKEKVMEVIVEDKQLSLAIGKRGQNVRLAARLLGWRIDIKSEEEKKREVQSQMDAAMATAETDVRVLEGIGEKTLKKLIATGSLAREDRRFPGGGHRVGLATRRRRRSCDRRASTWDGDRGQVSGPGTWNTSDGGEEGEGDGEGSASSARAPGVTDGADRGDGPTPPEVSANG
jgi:N utilization substance protein A